MTDPFKDIADQAHFNVYHSDLWRGTGRRFAEMIVKECAQCCGSQADRKNIFEHFGLPVESNVKSPAPALHGSVTSQYTREYNIPKGVTNNDL